MDEQSEFDEFDQLDPDTHLEEDRYRTSGSIEDWCRIILRTVRSMTEEEKADVRKHLYEKFPSHDRLRLTPDDLELLREIGIASADRKIIKS